MLVANKNTFAFLSLLCSSSSNKLSALTVARIYAPRERLQEARHYFIFQTSKVVAMQLTTPALLPTFEQINTRLQNLATGYNYD
jgi:hypothetical protein